jgi:hypothetical protein
MDHSALVSAIAAMQRLDGVAGILLFKGKNAIHKQMPFTDGRTFDLMDTLGDMLDGYQQVRRRIRSVYFQFDGGVLLVLVQEQAALVFFLMNRADVDLVAGAGAGLLRDFAVYLAGASDVAQPISQTAPEVEELVVTRARTVQAMADKVEPTASNWGAVRAVVERTLGKVMGRAQASNLIARTITDSKIDDPYRLPRADVLKLAISCIEHVPNMSKRRQLLMELEQDLAEQKL